MRQQFLFVFIIAFGWLLSNSAFGSEEEVKTEAESLVSLAAQLDDHPQKDIIQKISLKLFHHLSDDKIYCNARSQVLATLLAKLLTLEEIEVESTLETIDRMLTSTNNFLHLFSKSLETLYHDGAVLGLGSWLVEEVLLAKSLQGPSSKRDEEVSEQRTLGQQLMLDCGLYAIVAHSIEGGIDASILHELKVKGENYTVLNELLRKKLAEKKEHGFVPKVRSLKKSPGTLILEGNQILSSENILFASDLLDLFSGSLSKVALKREIIKFHQKKILTEYDGWRTYADVINVGGKTLEYLKSIDVLTNTAVSSKASKVPFWRRGPEIDNVDVDLWARHMVQAYNDVTLNIEGNILTPVTATRRERPTIYPPKKQEKRSSIVVIAKNLLAKQLSARRKSKITLAKKNNDDLVTEEEGLDNQPDYTESARPSAL